MPLSCPHCGSEDVMHRNIARKIGGAVGSVAGAASGAAGILGAARLGFVIGAPMGPYGALVSAIAAATLRAIVGATIGCEIGTALGELIDSHILESDACRRCGETFRPSDRRSTVLDTVHSWRYPSRRAQYEEDDDDPDEEDPGDQEQGSADHWPMRDGNYGGWHRGDDHRSSFPTLT